MHFFYTYLNLHYLFYTSNIINPIPHLAGGKAMMLAEAFVSGGLINAALVHLSLGVKNLEVIGSQ